MDKLMIDLETFSDVDIKKAGAYKYVGSPAFEILLFGASIDDGPVEQFDLASGESIPDAILDALQYGHIAGRSAVIISVRADLPFRIPETDRISERWIP